MSSAICFNLEPSKILSSGNGLNSTLRSTRDPKKYELFNLDCMSVDENFARYWRKCGFKIRLHLKHSLISDTISLLWHTFWSRQSLICSN